MVDRDGKRANREKPMMSSPPLPAMTGAELQVMREFLGLSTSWLAQHMAMNERRMMRMEADQESVPDALMSVVDAIADETKAEVHDMIAQYRRKVKASAEGDIVTIRTYRTDKEYNGKYPSRWHRMVCARVADGVPGLILVYR